MTPLPKKQASRLAWVDLFRGIAVALMFITHSSKLSAEYTITGPLTSFLSSVFDFFLQIEPFTFAAFIFLAGFSVTHHFMRLDRAEFSTRAYLAKNFRRFAGLTLASMALFMIENGIQWKPMIFASGAVATIAVMLLVVSVILLSRFRGLLLCAASALLIFANDDLYRHHHFILGLNLGAFPLLCGGVFGFYGALFSLFLADPKNKGRLEYLILLSAVVFVAASFHNSDWTYLHDVMQNSYGEDWSIFATLKGLAYDMTPKLMPFSYWHYLAISAVKMVFPLLATSWVAMRIADRLKAMRAFHSVYVFGRNSLFAYLFHVTLLTVIGSFELNLKNPAATLVIVVVAYITTYFACGMSKESWKKTK